MESPSFVSKARTAFHSAAAKAERVFIDIKSDFISDRAGPDSDKISPKGSIKESEDKSSTRNDSESKNKNEGKQQHMRWRPGNIGTSLDWQDRFKNTIRLGGKRVPDSSNNNKAENSTMAIPFYDENLYLLNMKNDEEAKGSHVSSIVERLNATNPDTIPPVSALKQLAVAVDSGKKFKSVKDILASSGASSPIMERASLSLAAVKSLVLRDKEDKLTSEFGNDEKLVSLIKSLFDGEGNFLSRNMSLVLEPPLLPRDIHAAPPESFLIKLSEVIGSFTTLRKMALFWCKIVTEIRRLWSEELYIPGIPMDEIPDLNSCRLYQQLQVVNSCISRKKWRTLATQSIESVMRHAGSCSEESADLQGTVTSHLLYARISTGELVLRLGVDRPAGNLSLLETGEPVYSPITQEGPLLTEDLIKETEEFVLRTGSVGAGCSQLLSDMQAFKAANPGCILEDFVRWHSPPDWTEGEPSDEAQEYVDQVDSSSTRGQLSSRMQKEGNLWRELWETAKPVPAVKQAPLFDVDLAVEGILNDLEEIPPVELFEQLFISLLGLGFVMAEAKLSCNNDLLKIFLECKDYIAVTCQGNIWSDKMDDLCQVYETVESMFLNPEEVLKAASQMEESNTVGEPKRRLKMLGLSFGSKEKNLRNPSKDVKNSEENSSRQPFSSFFDGKSSLFLKKPPRPESVSVGDKAACHDENENDWTIV
ncbi:RAB3 GTPASE-ACTIVATING PROTEIN CATALYTIC SUBUNIT [Salix purpurea]|uniref:RAB3 GTPASE-ACTIVATING PROTEIN CATALYTIC SUBUNIT n=2 Tax=Salix purpurea TaxID=77065 RepID=A0A9Q1AG80_SALPP|nr:RAB3 GTPASE-ACTIVATING PROTEIN CATALYTIC SUBUNIT [Salix purpurea]